MTGPTQDQLSHLLWCVDGHGGYGRHSREPVGRSEFDGGRGTQWVQLFLAWCRRSYMYLKGFFFLNFFFSRSPTPALILPLTGQHAFFLVLLGQPTGTTLAPAKRTYLAQMGRPGRIACSTKLSHLQVLIGSCKKWIVCLGRRGKSGYWLAAPSKVVAGLTGRVGWQLGLGLANTSIWTPEQTKLECEDHDRWGLVLHVAGDAWETWMRECVSGKVTRR